MAEETFEGNNMSGEPHNSNPQEVLEQEEDLEKGPAVIVPPEKRWPGWPGENVFRMLVPVQKVGGIIGRKGEFIKKMCEETKARIKILEGPPGATERTVLVSAKEEPENQMPPAMEGLMKVHTRMVDLEADLATGPPIPGAIVCTRLLLAATQAGSLIGKQGATIKSIQDASNCVVRVLGSENLPPFALPDDSIVEVQGEPSSVHKGVELIATHLRKFLVDRSVVGIFESQMQMHNRGNQEMAPPQMPWAPPQGFPPMNSGGGPGFSLPNHQFMPPPPAHQFDNYYPPPSEMPPLDKQQRQPPPAYGRDAPIGSHTPSMQTPSSIVTKVTQNMQIPLSYADAVIGISGSNISYIRRTSGATIAIQETRGIPGEMTVEINGSASQVQTAQQLIQNSIAEAASASQNSTGAVVATQQQQQQQQQAPPPAQAGQVQGYYDPYNPVASQGLADGGAAAAAAAAGGAYGYQAANPNQAPGAGADYGSVYGTNYGY